jgi:serine/threonine protein kinase
VSAVPELREQVGPYRVLRAIGSGGTARIDLARVERAYGFQRHVVIKRPLEHLRGDPSATASLRREARIGGRLAHPHLVAMLDAGTHDGYDYLVLEYVHGCSLRTLMQTDAPDGVRHVSPAVALGIVIDVARGLHHAHELRDERGGPLGLVHRDVSPGNVLLGLDGAIKLADFGIAKETRVATLSGSMHGTVTYMAPEQCRGHAFDRRADIWALGVILWELVAHTRLFWADNDVASLHKVLSGNIERPRKYEPALSKELEDVVMMAVAPDPQRRFASARELADALEALATNEGHVIGARWIARTVEEVVGAQKNPWIAAKTIPDPPRRSEGSLVAVIESLAPEAPRDVAFGPSDARLREEGTLPSSPSLKPAKPRSRRVLIGTLIVTAALAAGGVFAIGLAQRDGTSATTTPTEDSPSPIAGTPGSAAAAVTAPVPVPSPGSATSATAGSADTVAEPEIDDDQAATAEPTPPTPPAAGTRIKHPRPNGRGGKHGAHVTKSDPKTDGRGSAASTTQPPQTQGSAAGTKPPNVEWKPTMLLPTDPASGKSKSSGH